MTQYSTTSGLPRGDSSGSAGETNVAGEVKQTARQVAEKVKGAASQAMHEVRHQTSSLFDDRKSMACDKINHVADALRQAAQCVEEQDPTIGRLVSGAAGRVESLSTYLRDHEVRDILREGENFARRHPALFLGGMFVAGALTARFLKSSHERRLQERQRAQGGQESESANTDASYGQESGTDLQGGLQSRFERPSAGGGCGVSWEDS